MVFSKACSSDVLRNFSNCLVSPSVRVDLLENDVDLGNPNPQTNINNIPGQYDALGGGNINSGHNDNIGGGVRYSSAFWLSQSANFNMNCNRVRNGGYGFDVQGQCIPQLVMKNNLMTNLNAGLMLRPAAGQGGEIGVQGTLSPATSNYNVWNKSINNMLNHTFALNSPGNSTTLVVSTPDPDPRYVQNPNRNFSQGGSIVDVRPLLSTDYVYSCTTGTQANYFSYKQMPEESPSVVTEERMARGDYQDPNLQYDQQQRLLTILSESGNEAVYQSAVLDSFFKANQNTAMAGFIGVERLLDLKPETARLQNESLVPTNQQERNQQTYYRLYLSAARNEGKLSAGEYTELVKVAEQCPHTGGKAVQQARMMRFNLDLLVVFQSNDLL